MINKTFKKLILVPKSRFHVLFERQPYKLPKENRKASLTGLLKRLVMTNEDRALRRARCNRKQFRLRCLYIPRQRDNFFVKHLQSMFTDPDVNVSNSRYYRDLC